MHRILVILILGIFVGVIFAGGWSDFDKLRLHDTPEIKGSNGETFSNATNGYWKSSGMLTNVGGAMSYWIGTLTAGSYWFLGDTDNVWIPTQDIELTQLMLFGDPDSGDTLIVTVYDTANVIFGPDTLTGTAVTNTHDNSPSSTYKYIDVSSSEGIAIRVTTVNTFDNAGSVLGYKYTRAGSG